MNWDFFWPAFFVALPATITAVTALVVSLKAHAKLNGKKEDTNGTPGR